MKNTDIQHSRWENISNTTIYIGKYFEIKSILFLLYMHCRQLGMYMSNSLCCAICYLLAEYTYPRVYIFQQIRRLEYIFQKMLILEYMYIF